MGEYGLLSGLISNTRFPIVAFLLVFCKFDKTVAKNREDLEQEIFLMIIGVIKKKEFKKIPSFFELMEQEKQIKAL